MVPPPIYYYEVPGGGKSRHIKDVMFLDLRPQQSQLSHCLLRWWPGLATTNGSQNGARVLGVLEDVHSAKQKRFDAEGDFDSCPNRLQKMVFKGADFSFWQGS